VNAFQGHPSSASQLDAYQEAVRRLTAENRELNQKLGEVRRAHRQEIRTLEAHLNEGFSPELVTLRRELRKWKDRAHAAEGRLTEMRRSAR
jgi:chromosome segregation ATPase